MSRDESRRITAEIPGEWWLLASVMHVLLHHIAHVDALLSEKEWLFQHTISQETPGTYRASILIEDLAPEITDITEMHANAYAVPRLGIITFTGHDGTTSITVTTLAKYESYWNALIRELRETAGWVQRIRPVSISEKFDRVLAAYYAAKARGERPNLRRMADLAGVNYASLRQAKIRYDKKSGN